MHRLLLVVLLTVSSCSVAAGPATTSPPAETTTTLASTTSTALVVPMEIQDCSAPPVTFSTLCETIELLEEWHVDRPIDLTDLAALATEAAASQPAAGFEAPPRTFFCAIPDPAFTTLCDVLADRVRTEQVMVGPIVEAAVTSMIDVGLDPFTWYVPPELAAGFRPDGLVGGVGILLDATDAAGSKCARIAEVCPLRIVFVLEGNAGADAGLAAGDVVVSVDGQPVLGMGLVEVAAKVGGDGTGEVRLGIERDGAPIEVTVTRTELDLPVTSVETPLPGVGYLRIPDFSIEVPFLVDAAVDILAEVGPTTVVVDLRDNPGGLVEAVVSVASQFIADGTILNYEAPGESGSYEAHGGAPLTSNQLIVLVNGGTASAAEVLAGALRDRRGAIVIGGPTYGKNALQIPFDLRNGGAFHVAIARWTTPDGHSVGEGGLVPDRVVEFPAGTSIEELTRFAIDMSQ